MVIRQLSSTVPVERQQHGLAGVFARGFVRAYAQYIGIDPEVMVNAYLLELKAQKGETPVDSGLLRRGAWPEDVAEEPRRARRRIGVVVLGISLVLLVVVGALAAWWFLRQETWADSR